MKDKEEGLGGNRNRRTKDEEEKGLGENRNRN
jgi:hypothetical protein